MTDALTRLFGDRPLADILRNDAEQVRQAIVDAPLRPTTIFKRLYHARMMFREALTQWLISTNPFYFVRHRAGDVSERRANVPVENALRVIDHCLNDTWKLFVVLSRFAGWRTPSESFSLKWSDIDWERQRIIVTVPD